ncbi:GntR family transcriptional repressor for pyruvate dehydrogenase complex [Sporosarcina luteola]|nr:GntR family transcriptional repressor for pyruvate dehydrogenase complex [Sporosarcina luteola]
MEYLKIKSKKIYEQVADQLVEMIRSGRLKPGDRLDSVQQLAVNFQVGRSAVREALSALRAMGLIEIKQGEGTFVKEFDSNHITSSFSSVILMNRKDVENLLEVRKIIETGMVGLACLHRNDEHLAALQSALESMHLDDAAETADMTFHVTIAQASGNDLLISLMSHVSDLLRETIKETRKIWNASNPKIKRNLYEEHYAIYEAIVNQDSGTGQIAMAKHLESVETVLKTYYTEQNE